MATKTGNTYNTYISGTVTDISNGKSGVFDHAQREGTVKPTKLLVLPVIRLPFRTSSTHRRPTIWEVPLLERLTPKHSGTSCWNFVAMCSRTRDMHGRYFTPPPVAGKHRKNRCRENG